MVTTQLTSAQRTTLKAFILADPTLGPKATSGDYDGVANGLNALASPAWKVWRSSTPVDEITDAVVWANMTPAAAPDNSQLWANRALQCQGKQFNLQNLIIGKQAIDSSRVNIRNAFQDCLTQLPSAANGSNQPAGWVAVQTLMQRDASVAEKTLSTGVGSPASPADLGWEGTISVFQIGEIIA